MFGHPWRRVVACASMHATTSYHPWRRVGSGTSMYFADRDPSWVLERCESGRIGRSRKPLSRLRLRGFESHSLREVVCELVHPVSWSSLVHPCTRRPRPVLGLGRRLRHPWRRRPRHILCLGEMTEWPKVLAWKACVLVRVPWVRIPLSPYNPLGVDIQVIRYELLPNPARPGREQR